MLKPIDAPLECFGLSYKKEAEICRDCPHQTGCRELMGARLSRICVGEAKFNLVPEGFLRRMEEPDTANRDIEAIYLECWAQVFGLHRGVSPGSIGKFRDKICELARQSGLSVPLFILINMFAHSKTHPDSYFSPGELADGRAITRAKTYADACREHFGTVSPHTIDMMTGSDLADYSLDRRMLDSETLAGRWIIDYKLWHPGLPYAPMFEDIENELDAYWLATEQHYEEILLGHATRTRQIDAATKETRHAAALVYARMKKHKHHGISNFRVRESIMAEAVKQVLYGLNYGPDDFEIENKPITDPLLFWNRLALAIQHLECLVFVNYNEGIYAKP